MDNKPQIERKKPSRRWYVLAAALLVSSVGVFVAVIVHKTSVMRDRIEPMPRFVAPTGEDGFVYTAESPGKVNIFYENRGAFDGRSFDTHRRQVWTTFDAPAMTCEVTHIDTGEAVEVRLPGVGEVADKRKTTEDLVFTYDFAGRQGHSAWVFDADEPGDYRVVLNYVDAVKREPGSVTVPPELTKAEKKKMTSEEGEAYEEARRDAVERAALAELEPVDVLFAVGPDPTAGSFFEVIGLKGAATVLAFGFTSSILISLVTFMLRTGNVTPRGELTDVRRGFSSEQNT
ncbi:MAG: hypothetical protein ACE37H_15375 [Phycisphaeraceae bacterium]